MSVIVWIIFGGLVGLIGSVVLHTDRYRPVSGHILSAISGALAGGFLVTSTYYTPANDFDLYGVSIAVVGATVGLILFRVIAKR